MGRRQNHRHSGKSKIHRAQRRQEKTHRKRKKEANRNARRAVRSRFAQDLRDAVRMLMGTAPVRTDWLHGNANWELRPMITQLLLWVICEKETATAAFDWSVRKCRQLCGSAPFTSYNGLLKALVRYRKELCEVILQSLREMLPKVMGSSFRRGRWATFAVDGSRATAPRTKSNEEAFQSKTYGEGKTAKYRKKKTKGVRRRKIKRNPPAPPRPQIWMTIVQHIHSGIPWAWKLGPGNASERGHVQQILQETPFPANSLFIGDAGFVGFDFWSVIMSQGGHFCVRVGTNVELIAGLQTQDRLVDGSQIVMCWPKTQGTNAMPLKLRLIEIELAGEKAMLLTSVLDGDLLGVDEAEAMYKSRWAVELGYRSLKQTLNRCKVRSRRSDRALAEMDVSILLVSIVRFWAIRSHANTKDKSRRIKQISFVGALKAVRLVIEEMCDHEQQTKSLQEHLQHALRDDYRRSSSKQSRYRSSIKDIPKCGLPKVRQATVADWDRLEKTVAKLAA